MICYETTDQTPSKRTARTTFNVAKQFFLFFFLLWEVVGATCKNPHTHPEITQTRRSKVTVLTSTSPSSATQNPESKMLMWRVRSPLRCVKSNLKSFVGLAGRSGCSPACSKRIFCIINSKKQHHKFFIMFCWIWLNFKYFFSPWKALRIISVNIKCWGNLSCPHRCLNHENAKVFGYFLHFN